MYPFALFIIFYTLEREKNALCVCLSSSSILRERERFFYFVHKKSTKTRKRPHTLFSTNNIKNKQTNTTLRHFDNFSTPFLCIREGKKTRGERGPWSCAIRKTKKRNERKPTESLLFLAGRLDLRRLFCFPSLCPLLFYAPFGRSW